MSVDAASEIWRNYCAATDSKNEPMPSVFQGRIGGAKGMWMVCDEPSTTDPKDPDKWIEITPSQEKFEPHLDDLSDERFDTLRTTFEYVKHSSRPTSSELHKSFIPIMVDRGVPQSVMERIINDRLDVQREELLQMLPDPVKLHRWLHKLSPSITDEDPPWQAALPHSLANKIGLLLRSGFCPKKEPYLASVLFRYIGRQHMWMEQKLKVPLGKSAFLFGIADPLGVLAPGEVHVNFSSPFVDELSGTTYRALNNLELLVARQPACRRSDIQKVRAVNHPQLSHLVDVVVFPSRGQYPLAGKLQGGDYDGDVFWLCWELDLVRPFRNAPAPLAVLDHEQYCIQKDTRKLQEVMTHRDLSTVDNFLKEALEFRMAPSLLGRVTNDLEKMAYTDNKLCPKTLNALCDIHDLLVDAPKNGYRFNDDDYQDFLRELAKEKGKKDGHRSNNHDYREFIGNLKTPAYKEAMEDCTNAKFELGGADQARGKVYEYKKDNILDYLYFEVVRKHDYATLKMVEKAFPKIKSDDAVLQHPYMVLKSDNSVVTAEVASLVARIKETEREWSRRLAGTPNLTSEAYNKTVDHCYKVFRGLMPTDINHHDVKPLLKPYLHHDDSIWEYVRASALYTTFPEKHAFVWHMAGRELAKLKAGSVPGLIMIIPSIFANLKPKPIKAPKPEEAEEESEDEYESAVEHI
jgi:hypothetical protein